MAQTPLQPTTDVNGCDPDTSEWALNGLNQNPCLVAAYLGAQCSSNGIYNVPHLPSTNAVYNISSEATHCECSTVMFSLLNVCAACQLSIAELSWKFDTYDAPCASVSYASYPFDIPQGTEIPNWAYQNISANPNHTFDIQKAISVGSSPEHTATSVSSSTASPSAIITTTSAAAAITSSGSGGTKTSAGTIAGAVVGSIFALFILVIGAVFFLRRRRTAKRAQPQADMRYSYNGDEKPSPTPGLGPGMDLEGGTGEISSILTYTPNKHNRFLSGSTLNATIGSHLDPPKGGGGGLGVINRGSQRTESEGFSPTSPRVTVPNGSEYSGAPMV